MDRSRTLEDGGTIHKVIHRDRHEYHLYLYDDVAGAPPKAVLKDANEILLASAIFHNALLRSYLAGPSDGI